MTFGPMLLVLMVAATYRLARLTSGTDRLLKGHVEHAQEWFEARWAAEHPKLVDPAEKEWQSQWAYFAGCPYCQAVWIAGALTVMLNVWFVEIPLPGLVAVAVAGGSSLCTAFENFGE